jgi:hypothetical protein
VNEGCPWLSVSRLARDTMQRSWIQALFFLAYERLINLWNRTIRVYYQRGLWRLFSHDRSVSLLAGEREAEACKDKKR